MRYLIVGSGMRGICDCLAILKKDPSASVYLVDTAEKFGGAVSGLAVEGFAVDPGVHLFDSIPRDFADFLDGIAAGGMKEIAVKSASTFNGVKTDGFSLPDLSTLSPEVKAKIKAELLDDCLVNRKVDDSLNGLFQERFGSTVSDVYSAIYRHIYSIQSLEVSRDAVHSTSLHRLKFDTDEEMIDLKNRSARLDNALAARRASRDTSSESSVTVYPSDGRGMAGLNQDIQRWLAEAGVKICLGVSISAVEKVGSVESKVILSDDQTITVDRIIWSANNFEFISNLCDQRHSSLSEHMHYAPMVLAVLVGEESAFSDYTYMQNFDVERVTFRSASAGSYSNQIVGGKTFITCECPASVGSTYWNNHDLLKEDLTKDLLESGFIKSDRDITAHFFNAPRTFFAPKREFAEHFEPLAERAWADFGIFVKDPRVFFRREMIADSQKLAESGFDRCA